MGSLGLYDICAAFCGIAEFIFHRSNSCSLVEDFFAICFSFFLCYRISVAASSVTHLFAVFNSTYHNDLATVL